MPIVVIIYYCIPHKIKNPFLLVASAFFYAWGAPKFIFVILITTLFDFFIVKAIASQTNHFKKKLLFIFSISVNIGLLFYFKYLNFFIDNINIILSANNHEPIALLNIILPIGISFYTFESLTYVVDVYFEKHKPLKNFMDYQLYILLFPKLIAGPIIRYSDIADQITNRFKNYNAENIIRGFRRFVMGLAKKVLIANTIGVIADQIFNSPFDDLNNTDLWIGMFAYTFQLYFDFSGYSDIALGVGIMLGFNFPENFNNPYNANSVTDFWRRWHISLGAWMRNYLYIPLGGNQASIIRIYFNLWIVFLISGFWHGAEWTFIAWGVYHGFFLVLERMGFLKILNKIPNIIAVGLTFLVVSLGWVLFRAKTFMIALNYISNLFSFKLNQNYSVVEYSNEFIVTFLIAVLFSFCSLIPYTKQLYYFLFLKQLKAFANVSLTTVALILFYICISYIAISTFNPFIYFRF
ncbi:MAG: MBOAT family protein [Bacteroidetes bacterium]|nr:MBOAT family protein [Bacteroidota bacterium]